ILRGVARKDSLRRYWQPLTRLALGLGLGLRLARPPSPNRSNWQTSACCCSVRAGVDSDRLRMEATMRRARTTTGVRKRAAHRAAVLGNMGGTPLAKGREESRAGSRPGRVGGVAC